MSRISCLSADRFREHFTSKYLLSILFTTAGIDAIFRRFGIGFGSSMGFIIFKNILDSKNGFRVLYRF